MEGLTEKRCRDCGETKPIVEFWRWAASKDGRHIYCAACGSVRNARSAARRRERRGLPPVKLRRKAPEVPAGIKWCRDCDEIKRLDDFPLSKKASGRGTYCKPCFANRATSSRIKVHGNTREYHLRHRYGIGTEDVERMLAAQGNRCLICGRPDPEHVDHSHETGKVRGILCFNCNQGLGNFRDDVRILVRAANYLMRGSSWNGKGLEAFQVGTGCPAPAA